MDEIEPIEITVKKQTCTRCKFSFWPKIDDETNEIILPKTCRNQECNSPYWNVEKTRFLNT